MKNIAFRTLGGEFCEKEHAVFDIIITRRARSPVSPSLPPSLMAPSSDTSSAWVRLRVSFDVASGYVKLLRGSGGRGVLVPSCYADPKISYEDAERIARAEYERISLARKGPLGPLARSAHDEVLSWTFFARDLQQPDDIVPGGIFISVDKMDGHIQSDDEIMDWSRLGSEIA